MLEGRTRSATRHVYDLTHVVRRPHTHTHTLTPGTRRHACKNRRFHACRCARTPNECSHISETVACQRAATLSVPALLFLRQLDLLRKVGTAVERASGQSSLEIRCSQVRQVIGTCRFRPLCHRGNEHCCDIQTVEHKFEHEVLIRCRVI